MKKGRFYNSVWASVKGGIRAVETEGYVEGDFGLSRSEGYWAATHIPTGALMNPRNKYRTARQALDGARAQMERTDPRILQQFLGSKEHQAFLRAKARLEKDAAASGADMKGEARQHE